MLEGRHPLRERMTLFWHGYFTSSHARREAHERGDASRRTSSSGATGLGDFARAAAAIVRDPAMLEYLDNNQNRKGQPERELRARGDGALHARRRHYTELDIKEARAR
jgi:uncharacterized protein (DUF1800 family)